MTTVLVGYPPEGALKRLSDLFPAVEFRFAPESAEQRSALAHCEAFVCPGRAFTSAVAGACARSASLRWLQMCSAGVDHVLRFNLPGHIRICRGGSLWNKPVAEHALAMMLALARGLPEAERDRSRRRWDFAAAMRRIDTLEGKRLLVLGFGEIGLALAQRARALDMHVTGIGRQPRTQAGFEVCGAEDLERLLPQADVLAIALPGGADTLHMMGETQLSLLPAGAMLINVGRGTVVDSEALADALRRGHLGGAGLDVTDPEPCPGDSPLWSLPNVVVTPHVAGETPRWPDKVARLVERNLAHYMAGRPLAYEIDRRPERR